MSSMGSLPRPATAEVAVTLELVVKVTFKQPNCIIVILNISNLFLLFPFLLPGFLPLCSLLSLQILAIQ